MSATHGPIPNRPARGTAWLARGRTVATLILLVLAALIGWLVHSPGTKTVTRTIAPPPATIYKHNQAGAVAAAEANLVQAETSCLKGYERCQSPSAYSLGPDGGGLWSLAYRVKSYSPTSAVIEAWQFGVDAGGGGASSRLAWGLADVPVKWTGTEWRQEGQVSQTASGPTPPPDQTSGLRTQAFARTIASFWRFPGAP